MEQRRYLSAREAATLLGISEATLYAYVSRGFIRSEEIPGERRARRYRAEEIERLRERQGLRRDPARAAREALQWGEPVLESSISLIENGRLFYRGRDVEELAREASVEEVAALIWSLEGDGRGMFDASSVELPRRWPAVDRAAGDLSSIERLQMLLPLIDAGDPSAYDGRAPAVKAAGTRIVQSFVALAGPTTAIVGGVAATLARAWGRRSRRERELLSAALVVAVDHELNVSAFTVRCVASAASTPYAAISAGLGALRGARHGGMTERVEHLVAEIESDGDAARVVGARMRRGEAIPGFGHPLYRTGDPRGRLLLELAHGAPTSKRALRPIDALLAQMERIGGDHPSLDLGLVAVARALGLPAGSALTLFALGRVIGWIGHAIEQYASGRMIRPRAVYAGRGSE